MVNCEFEVLCGVLKLRIKYRHYPENAWPAEPQEHCDVRIYIGLLDCPLEITRAVRDDNAKYFDELTAMALMDYRAKKTLAHAQCAAN